MPRLPRFDLAGQAQHVIQRGNNREPVFAYEEDYGVYLNALGDACARFGCALHAYVLMTNHVHLLITPEDGAGLGRVMQSVGRRYVGYFNTAYGRTGTLWEGRYRATLIDSERYLLACMRYVELNPVRAGMVRRPRDYPYSSHGGNALGRSDPLLTPHELYTQLGATPEDRCQAYRALFRGRLGEETLQEIREATNKAWVLGNDRFRDKVERLTQRRAAPKPRGGDRKSKAFRDRQQINRV